VAEAYKEVIIHHSPEAFRHFLTHSLYWAVFFICFHYFLVYILHSLTHSQWLKHMDAKKIAELPGYLTSLVHHIGISPLCLYIITTDYLTYSSSEESFPPNHYTTTALYSSSGLLCLFPFTFGYFIGDSVVFAIPESFVPGIPSKIFLIHHVVALSMIYATYTLSQGSLTQVFAGMY
jgi:hypothetical protein